MEYQKIARKIVLDYANEHIDKTDNMHITLDNVYLVWFGLVFQNLAELESTCFNRFARRYVL